MFATFAYFCCMRFTCNKQSHVHATEVYFIERVLPVLPLTARELQLPPITCCWQLRHDWCSCCCVGPQGCDDGCLWDGVWLPACVDRPYSIRRRANTTGATCAGISEPCLRIFMRLDDVCRCASWQVYLVIAHQSQLTHFFPTLVSTSFTASPNVN